jgi:signal transduction histidine kinase
MTPLLLSTAPSPVTPAAAAVAANPGLRDFALETCEAVCGLGRLQWAALALVDTAGGRIELVALHGDADDAPTALMSPEGAQLAFAAAESAGFAAGADGSLVVAAAPAGALQALIVGRRHDHAWGWDAGLPQLLEGSVRIAGIALRERLAAAAEERRRADRARTELACEIHEEVVQRMFGVSLALSDAGPIDDELRQLCSVEVERALADLRAIIRRAPEDAPVRPAGLDEALAALRASGVVVEIACDELTATPAQQAIARSVLAEALRNARKHSEAEHVRVTVAEEHGLLKLSVVNDGVRGPGRGRTPRSGVGLQLAATEAAQGGGVLEHGPEGPGRWCVRLALPLEERDEHVVVCRGGSGRGPGG